MKKTILAVAAVIIAFTSSAAGLKKSVTWENIRNHPAPLPVIGEVSPKPSELDRPSLWSVGSETLDRDFAKFDNYIQYMKATGVGYARLQSGWAKSEPKIGKYNFGWIDHQVDALLEQGIRPWICLCYGNPAYTDLGYDLNAGIFTDGPVMEGWLKYVRQVVRRFKGKVIMYEVWNEPDGAKGADGKPGSNWKEYANLFVRTSQVIREEDPSAKIAALGTLSVRNGYANKVLNIVKERGAADNVDFVTYHGYFDNPDGLRSSIEQFKKDVQEIIPNAVVLQGENGCPAQLEYGHALANREWTECSQAKWDLRNALMNFSLGMPSNIFTMVDLNYGWMIQSFGLIRMNLKSEPQYLRPKYYAVQHLTSLIGAQYKASENVKITRPSTSDKITLVGVEKEGRTVGYLIWFSGNIPTSSLEREYVNMTVEGATLENPVYVDMLSGYIHDISRNTVKVQNGMQYKGLPLWDSPVLVIEKSEIGN